MFKYLLAASALALVSTPAAARDGAAYFGIEGGGIFVGDLDFDLDIDIEDEAFSFDDAVEIKLSPGYDIDAIAGYDFGMFRAEIELGRKRLNVDTVEFSDELFEEEDLDDVDIDIDLEDSRGRVTSLMGNVLFDAFNSGGTSAYIGGGIGMADVKFEDAKDSAMAWQLIAGVRAPITDFIEAGVKYRFFNTAKLRFADDEDEDFGLGFDGRLQTHSLLASLIFNFGGAPVAAPVVVEPAPVVVDTAPPPPATQTCSDGSVILATAVCPPPPAPPAGERG